MDQGRSLDSALTPSRMDEAPDLAAAVEAAETATSVHVPSGRCVAANDLLARITGRPLSVMVGRRISDVLVDGDPETDQRLFDVLQRDGIARERFHTFIPGRGFRWLEVTACRALVVGRRLFQVQWSDVTARMREEDADATTVAIPIPSEAPSGFSAADLGACLDGRTTEGVLQALCAAFDARAACLATPTSGEGISLSPSHGVALPSVRRAGSIFEILAGGAPGETTDTRIAPGCPVIRADGFAKAVAVEGAADRPGESLLVVFDPAREASPSDARALLQAAAAALRVSILREELNRLSTRTHLADEVAHLARGIAHGINNDLTCILGSAFQLRGAFPDDSAVTRHVNAIEESSAHAASVAGALQNVVRAASRRVVEIDLPELIETAVTLIGGASKRTEITTHVTDDLPPFRGERHALVQALLNLLQNAVDAMDDRGRITVTAGPAPGGASAVEITVRDDGRGIRAEHLAHVHEAGFTTLGEAAGRGLGLTIVERIVNRHGGELVIESVEGEGTSVRMVLPARS